MAADIYTKGFADAAKWFTLCGLINVLSDGEISSGKLYHRATVSSDASAKDYKEDKMPPDMEGLDRSFGWHSCDNGSSYLVVREPKVYREHSNPTSTFVPFGSRRLMGGNK